MKKSSLLIKEPPLVILPSLAQAIGLNEAIIVQQLHYWLENPKAGVIRDGEKWIFNTYEELRENFPFWSVATIQRIFSGLEKRGLIISAQLDARKHDQKKFYHLDYDELCKLDHINLIPSTTAGCYDDNRTTVTTTESKTATEKIITEANNTVNEILKQELNPRGLEKQQVQNRFEAAFRISPAWDGVIWRDFDNWLLSQERKGRTIEDWASWWKSDEFRREKQTANLNPSKIKQNWNLAFDSIGKVTQEADGGMYV